LANIEHIVVLMLENRSFDHLFGFYPNVDGLKGNEYNLLNPWRPESAANPRVFVGQNAVWNIVGNEGPNHSLKSVNKQLFGVGEPAAGQVATNNGFILSYHDGLFGSKIPSPTIDTLREAMQTFTPARLPALNGLAEQFVLCDRWFSDVPGPTQPNRLFTHLATSNGFAYNVWDRLIDGDSIYNLVERAGNKWAVYYSDDNDAAKFVRLRAKAYTTAAEQAEWEQDQKNGALGGFFDFQTFFSAHAADGTLAQYVFIEPAFGEDHQAESAINSMHAPHDVRPGDRLVADVYEALRQNEQLWAKTMFILTFDEHGGFYDHVIPPAVDNPDGVVGQKSSRAPAFGFDRLGLRVPSIIASPWVAKGQIVHDEFRHTSIIATAREVFGLGGPLTRRDESARTFSGLLTNSPRTDTPTTLPRLNQLEEAAALVNRKNVIDTPASAPDELLAEKAAAWHRLMTKQPASPWTPASVKEAQRTIRDSVKEFARARVAAEGFSSVPKKS